MNYCSSTRPTQKAASVWQINMVLLPSWRHAEIAALHSWQNLLLSDFCIKRCRIGLNGSHKKHGMKMPSIVQGRVHFVAVLVGYKTTNTNQSGSRPIRVGRQQTNYCSTGTTCRMMKVNKHPGIQWHRFS